MKTVPGVVLVTGVAGVQGCGCCADRADDRPSSGPSSPHTPLPLPHTMGLVFAQRAHDVSIVGYSSVSGSEAWSLAYFTHNRNREWCSLGEVGSLSCLVAQGPTRPTETRPTLNLFSLASSPEAPWGQEGECLH